MSRPKADERQRYIPEGYQPVYPEPNDIPAVIYTRTIQAALGRGPRWCAIAYQGTRTKNDWFESFRTPELLANRAARWFEQIRRTAEAKAARAEAKARARAKGHPFKAGDIFYNSWGYEQTQCDFYEATATTRGTVTLQAIGWTTVEGSQLGMSETRMPTAGAFLDEPPVRKTVQYYPDGRAYLSAEHGCMSPWDGKPHYVSWYA